MLTMHYMLSKFQTPIHSMRGQMLLRQHKALLQPSARWRLSYSSRQLSQDDPQQSMPALFSGFAHKAIYHPYIEHLPKPAKHEKQRLQQSLHLKHELIITKKL